MRKERCTRSRGKEKGKGGWQKRSDDDDEEERCYRETGKVRRESR